MDEVIEQQNRRVIIRGESPKPGRFLVELHNQPAGPVYDVQWTHCGSLECRSWEQAAECGRLWMAGESRPAHLHPEAVRAEPMHCPCPSCTAGVIADSEDDAIVLRWLVTELRRSRAKHPPHHSAHETLGVLSEEYDEFKAEVYRQQLDKVAARSELVQLAGVAVRAITDLKLRELGMPTS